jgi:hypothetical protein
MRYENSKFTNDERGLIFFSIALKIKFDRFI